MRYILLIGIAFLLASCKEGEQHKDKIIAMETGEKARMEWQKVLKPVEIIPDNMVRNVPAWPCLGVYVGTSLAGDEKAFAGKEFMKKGNKYVPSDSDVMMADTAAIVRVCYPFHKGLYVHDTLRLDAPFGENLYGVETGRSIESSLAVRIRLQSSMALLRIACESDDLRDRLDGISITGERIYTHGSYQPYTGKWMEEKANRSIRVQTDCLLNNGRNHNFYLIPTGTASPVTIGVRINGVLHDVRTTIPPLPPGCLVYLSLRKEKDGLAINGSWVETERPLVCPVSKARIDSVRIGHYLQADGTIQAGKDTLTVAVVVETDGRHGKAVSLTDSEGHYVFSGKEHRNGKTFATLDGKRKEGILNPTEGIKTEDAIIYKPGMPYPEDCALGYSDGASLTQRLLDTQGETLEQPGLLYDRRSMLGETRRHPGSYVPSIAEMAWLYYRLECDKDFRRQVCLDRPEGEYLTSSESGEQTFYRIDFTYGIVTGQLSKRYAQGKLRLFYLF